jgi:hypothetical protein
MFKALSRVGKNSEVFQVTLTIDSVDFDPPPREDVEAVVIVFSRDKKEAASSTIPLRGIVERGGRTVVGEVLTFDRVTLYQKGATGFQEKVFKVRVESRPKRKVLGYAKLDLAMVDLHSGKTFKLNITRSCSLAASMQCTKGWRAGIPGGVRECDVFVLSIYARARGCWWSAWEAITGD